MQAGAVEACRAALKGYDPLLRALARKRIRRAVRAATSHTTVHEPTHLARIAYLIEAKQNPDAVSDDVAAIAVEQAGHAAELRRPPRRGPWLTGGILSALAVFAVGVVLISALLRPFDPRSTAVGRLLSGPLVRYVVASDAGDANGRDRARKALTGWAAKRALGGTAAPKLEQLLDAAEAVNAHPIGAAATEASHRFQATSVDFVQALRETGLPYFLDEVIRVRGGRPVPLLFSYYVQQDAVAVSGSHEIRVVHLWRLDDLNLYHGSLGLTRPHTPAALVLLDRVETDLVLHVLPALPPGEVMLLLDEETQNQQPEWADGLPEHAAALLRKHHATLPQERAVGVDRVGKLLARRRALVKRWSGLLAAQSRVLKVPRRLIPERNYSQDLELRIPRAELREWDDIHGELLQEENHAAFVWLRDDYAASVERHEVQHRLDFDRGLIPVPEILARRLGVTNRLDASLDTLPGRSCAELSAYLASIAQARRSPLLDLTLLARFLFNKHSLGGPYAYAALAAFEGLGEELGVDVAWILGDGRVYRPQLAKLFLAVTRHPPGELRAAAARLYQRAYGQALPQVSRKSVRTNPPWRH